MADRRLTEDGTDLRQLEDASGLRLLADGPNVAGGEIAFPGGYGYGSGGYNGGGLGSGGGGLSGGGQGGAGSGGGHGGGPGSGEGTTTTVPLPFKPGLVLFIATNQTLNGWRTYEDDMSFHWTCSGVACWASPDKSSVRNFAHATHYTAVGHEPYPSGVWKQYGSGHYTGQCIWINNAHNVEGALAHVSSFNDDGFDLEWDLVDGAGYGIYFVAARDQLSWGDHTTSLGGNAVILNGLEGGKQDNRPQGGFAFFHGLNTANGETYNGYDTSSVSFWARPDKGNNFEPVGGAHASKHNVYEQASLLNPDPNQPGDAESDYFISLPGNLHGIVMSPWIIGTVLQGWSSLYLTNGQAQTNFSANAPQGFAWATGALDSCDARFYTPAVSGELVHELRYDYPPNESQFKGQIGFTYSRPRSDYDGYPSAVAGHAVGVWARMVEDQPEKDFHATIAMARHVYSGRVVCYRGTDFSWIGEFSMASPGSAPAGRIEYQSIPGEIVTHTDVPSASGRLFMMWMNGIQAGGWLPQSYRLRVGLD